MVQSSSARTGFWQSVRDLPGRTSLRVKLITAVLVLVVIALTVISFVGISVLRDNLIGNVDSALSQLRFQTERGLGGPGFSLGGQQAVAVGDAVIWIPDKGKLRYLEIPVSASGYAPGTYGRHLAGPSLTAAQASALSSSTGAATTVGSADGSMRWRVVGIAAKTTSGTPGTIVVAVDATSEYRTIAALTLLDLVVSLLIVLALAFVGAGVVRASLRPLTDIEQTAGAIADGDLGRRVPERDPRTEVGRLGRSLNAMLSQIESAFRAQSRSEAAARRSEEKMRQFVADASHELRTPLTAIRGFGEYYRQRGGVAVNGAGQLAPADLDRIMRRVEQEAARMGILVEDMLLLARLDQQRPLEAQPVDLLTLAADAVHDARVVAPDRSINLTVGSGRALLVIGDEVRLRQVIGNLMSNALTHTPAGSPIDVTIRSGDLDEAASGTAMARPGAEPLAADALASEPAGEPEPWSPGQPPPPPPGTEIIAPPPSGPAAVLEVADSGPGLSSDQAAHVFERFYRADPARTIGGNGLGLAIVAALVAAHGGATWVRSQPGAGATFCIALPLSPDAMHDADDDFEPDSEHSEHSEQGADEQAPGFTATSNAAN